MVSPFNKRNYFDLTHDRLLSLDMGQLVPVDCMEVLPGDTFKLSPAVFSRLEAMLAPALVDIDLLLYQLFVPNRILMEDKDWESFITGGVDGNSTVVAPYMVSPVGGYAKGSLADHLGIRPGVAGIKHSAFPFRAYAKIYNEYFRDQNLISEVALSTADGLDTTTNTDLLNKCWEKDYFTSALPWPQRGSAATIPFNNIPVVGNGKTLGITDGTQNYGVGSITAQYENNSLGINTNTYGTNVGTSQTSGTVLGKSIGLTTDPEKSGLEAMMTQDPITINALRTAIQVQKFLEKQARGGARLVETILSHFGVRVPDARLQRPELLNASRLRFMISPVEQTSSTDETTPQGNLAGRGTLNSGIRPITKSFVEHGYVITLVSVMPRTVYGQGLPRMYSRDSRYDYYWPVFAHLGEQEVRNKEIFVQGTSDDDGIFGYNDRGAEYRHIPSSVSGEFRPGGSLEFWTLVRKFENKPELNAQFVTADPSKRIFAVQNDTPSITMLFRNKVDSWRCIPKYGNPGLIDHD